METNIKTADVLADQEAPMLEELKKQAFSAIMKLTEEEKVRVLSKYAERYGECVAG